MPSGKNCLVCETPLVIKTKRDTYRKKFCSSSCRGYHAACNRPVKEVVCTCGVTFSTTSTTGKFCSDSCKKGQQIHRSYKMMHNNPEKYFQHLLYKKGRELLTVDILMNLLEEQGGVCAISGQELTFTKKPNCGRINTNASIDQIVAGGGYTKNNIQIVCDVVNRMKIDMTETELKFWCSAILEG